MVILCGGVLVSFWNEVLLWLTPHTSLLTPVPPILLKIIFLTAGAAGMYCGSCMHDNSLTMALRRAGHECILQPLYTPIRTDVPSLAREQLFYGGIHIYLLQRAPWLAKLPRFLRRPLDFPPLVRFLTGKASSVDAGELGGLTVSMLRGLDGRQADEGRRLIDWLKLERPDMIVWSNLLIAGIAPSIRLEMPTVQQVAILQGDDIFLDHLRADHRRQTIDLMTEKAAAMDRLIVNSHFYSRTMGSILGLAPERFEVHPLSIQPATANDETMVRDGDRFDIGYMARIAPEKGLHVLVDAFIRSAERMVDSHLHVAGYLASTQLDYLNEQTDRIATAGLIDRYTHHGEVSAEEKRRLLRRMSVASVPTTYADPKGLFVLESLDAMTPVIQPDHGAFGELVGSTGGGLLFPPGDSLALADRLIELHQDETLRRRLATNGKASIAARHHIDLAAERLIANI